MPEVIQLLLQAELAAAMQAIGEAMYTAPQAEISHCDMFFVSDADAEMRPTKSDPVGIL